MRDVSRKEKKPNLSKIVTIEPIPGVPLVVMFDVVEIRLIPALAALAGTRAEFSEPSNYIYPPSRAFYLSKNEDGTYAVLNRLEPTLPSEGNA